MNKNSLKLLRPLLLIFIILNAFFIASKSWLLKWGADQDVLIVGNLLVFLVSFFAFFLSYRALQSSNPQAFVRAMYGSFIIKFFVIAISAFIYIKMTGKEVNKISLFTCMGLYLVYTFIEVSALMKLLKQKKNA
ncbi:MAG TPA: hypothetical protein VF487_03135 [Chitinophagaceae bacterium]